MTERNEIARLDSDEWDDVNYLVETLRIHAETSDNPISTRYDEEGIEWTFVFDPDQVIEINARHAFSTYYKTMAGDTRSYGLFPETSEVEHILMPCLTDYEEMITELQTIVDMGLNVPSGDDLLPLKGLLRSVRAERLFFSEYDPESEI